MGIGYRLLGYMLLWSVCTIGYVGLLLLRSQARLQEDPSAMAWVAFLPLLLPFFAVAVGKVVLCGAAVLELAIAVRTVFNWKRGES